MSARAAIALVVVCFGTAAAADTHEVRIISDYDNLSFRFEPKVIEIAPGDTVVWINDVAEEHNVMTYPGGRPEGSEAIESPLLAEASERFSYTFSVEGTYQYHCMPHLLMGMNGEVVVGQRTSADGFHQPSRNELTKYRDQLVWWFGDTENLMHVRMNDKPE